MQIQFYQMEVSAEEEIRHKARPEEGSGSLSVREVIWQASLWW